MSGDLPKKMKDIDKIIAMRGNPELIKAWRELVPFFETLSEDLYPKFLDVQNWSDASDNLKLILEIIKSLPGNLTVSAISSKVAEIVQTRLGFEYVIVNAIDFPTGTYHRIAHRGLPEERFEQLAKQVLTYDDYKSLLNEKYRVSNSYIIRWWHDEARIPHEMTFVPDKTDEHAEWSPEDMLLVPIRGYNGDLLGSISLDGPPDGKMPSKNIIMALEILATQAGQAFEESRIYIEKQKRLDETEFLFDVSQFAANVETEFQLMDYVCEKILLRFSHCWAGIFLLNDETRTLRMASTSAAGNDAVGFSKALSLDGREAFLNNVIALGHYKIFGDIDKAKNAYKPFNSSSRSVIAVPIRQRTRILGVFVIESAQPHAFGQEDRKFTRTIVNQIATTVENLEVKRRMEEELAVRRTLFEIGTVLNTILEPPRLFRKIMDILKTKFNFSSAALFLLDDYHEHLVLKAFSGFIEREIDTYKLKFGTEGVVGLCASTKKPITVPDVSKFPMYVRGFPDTKSELAVPILFRDSVLGVLDIESSKLNGFSERDISLLELFATQISIAIYNAQLYDKLESIAVTDGLTRLYNYRSFMEQLSRELARASIFGHTVCLVFCDLDSFKRYNDTFGHQEGDMVLEVFAKILTETTRANVDIAARYGGDEFAIILPEVDLPEAVHFAEKIRELLSDTSKETLLRRVTISTGVACFPHDAKTMQDLLKIADDRTYKAKQSGKNQTCAT